MPDELDDPIALPEPSPDVLLHVHGLRREFAGRRRLGRAAPAAVAVDEIDLQVRAGETLALVGESGSGKSTTARMVLRLLDATGGQIVWAGTDISRLRGRPLRRVRADLQAVFQDPTGSLDPTMTIGKHLVAAVRLHRGGSRADARARAAELVGLVGLRAAHLDRYPSELSGGQRQRVVLARALAAQPRLIVLDEPVSSLDVSTQSQAVNLLADLQRELGLAYLLIAHDLPLVRHLSHRVAVMYLGTIVEEGPTEQIFDRPRHPYTQALLSLVPTIEGQGRPPIVLPGEMPPPTAIPSGCRFRTRCPYVFDVCLDDPPMMTFEDTGRTACHLHTSEPWLAGATVHGLLDEHGQPDSAEPSDHESTLAREA